MTQTTRQQRIRQLVRRLNRQRKQQARQIDILCNDLIGAQREFISRLGTISFATSFYQAILGVRDCHTLFTIAGQHIHKHYPTVYAVFCRPGYEPWCFRPEHTGMLKSDLYLEQYLDEDVVAAISRANQQCDSEDMLALGLQVNPHILSMVETVSVPMADAYRAEGFLLLYRGDREFDPAELVHAEVLAGGVARVLTAIRTSCSPETQP